MRRRLPPAAGGDYLTDLAAEINTRHRHVTQTALEGARDVGRLLLQAQAQVGDKAWEPWVQKHCDFSTRTAYDYLRVARYWDRIDGQATSIAGAIALLRPQSSAEVERAFPELPAVDQAEFEGLMETESAKASAERKARAEEKAERRAQPPAAAKLRCPHCGHCWKV